MKKDTVVLVAGTDYDNLGIGYLSAVLSESGIETKVVDFRKRESEIMRIIERENPVLVGFSILFLDHFEEFINLISYLRNGGIKCHFTAGGHYASLRTKELLCMIPQIDSIVRFEGEYTLSELVQCIKSGTDWKRLKSLAYVENGQVVLNPLRPLENDLDKFPFPVRSPLFGFAFGKKFATLIAGRGCIYQCSFCNTRKFYSLPPGEVKRIRRPEMVVKEMEYLYKKCHCSVFLFQDDDFPVKSKLQPKWIEDFCAHLERTGLNGKVIWKISCRPDEVEEDSFILMKNHGLFNVFLGIEDGTDIGLKALNKHLTVESNIRAVSIIKKLGLDLDYGFILFQPLTTFTSINQNLGFLKTLFGDGYTPIPFQKLLPLYETLSEEELIKSGRLKIIDGMGDYDFLEVSMNHYFDYISESFNEWMRGPEGVGNLSKWARNYLSVYKSFFEITPAGTKIHRKVRKIISESNLFLVETLKELALIFESKQHLNNNTHLLEKYREKIVSKQHLFRNRIIYAMADLVTLVEEQQALVHN